MKKNLLLLLFTLLMGIVYSQTQPLSLVTKVSKSKTILNKNTPVLDLPSPDVSTLLREDAISDKNGEVYRIGVALNVNINLIQFGSWETLPSGDKKLTAVIKSNDAHALSFEFDQFYLPEGGTIRAYNKGQWHFSEFFTSEDNRSDNGFFIPMVYGDEVIIEIIEPSDAPGQTVALLENVFYNYRSTGNPMVQRDFDDSDACQINVNCSPEGDLWQDEKEGVARIYIVEGFNAGWCTGSLVNNTAQDCKPYFLTALHCGETTSAADMNNWIFYFGYEASGCTNPASEGTLGQQNIQGCFRIADSDDGGGASGSDFLLLQLGSSGNESTTVNTLKSYNAYWNGWDSDNTTSNEGVGIHHPSGDIKKISTYSSNLQTTQWGSATGSHWQVNWSSTSNGHGVTEGGSSGSPIFRYTGSGSNENSKIIGTLTGGSSFCNSPNSPDQYGKMSYHWNSNGGNNNQQLEPWLDPTGSGVSTLDGSSDPCTPSSPDADFTANQTNVLEGEIVDFTDQSIGVPTSWSWTITPGTNTVEWEYVNGTSNTDQNPEVQFNTAGTYTVELTATNAQGSDVETKVDYIIVDPIVCGDPLSSAYTMGFENGEDLSQWLVINANNDLNSQNNQNTWGIDDLDGLPQVPQNAHGGTNGATYFYNDDATTPADDWIITGCMDLVAGANYTLTYWWTTDDGYSEDLEVFIGTDQTVASMNTSIQDLGTVQDNTWTQETVNFTVPSDDEYYVGWHCTSAADQYYIAIDDINLTGTSTGITLTNTPNDITVECDESTDPSNTGDLTATTDCNPNTVTIDYTDNVTTGSCVNEYTIERTWTADDNCGNSETHVQIITVEDNTAPVVTCGQSSDIINTSGGTASLPDYESGSSFSDNCTSTGDLITSQNPAAGTPLTPGTYNVAVIVEDECGNIDSCNISVTVEDNEEITITNTPNDVTVECDESTDPSNTGDLTATTSCNPNTVTINYTDNTITGSCVNDYTIERTWTVDDNCGNSETHVQIITVEDNTEPVVTCGQSTDQINTTTGSATLPDYISGSSFNDNCTATGDLIITQSPSAGTTVSPSTHTVTVSAEDECGNIGTCEVEVTVINDNGITINSAPNDIAIECDESSTPSNTGGLTAQTDCSSGGLTINHNDSSDGNTCPETITRSWTVTDNCGNSETHVQIITIEDNTAPTANNPGSILVDCIDDVPAVNTTVVNASDNCDLNPAISHVGDVSDGNTCPEVITRTYSVEDECGNFIEVEQEIIINDEVDPQISCPADSETIYTSEEDEMPDYTSTTNATDNCTSSPVVTQSPSAGTALTLGTTTVTLTATDDCGNESTCSIEVLYEDDASIEDEAMSLINIYPNPVTDVLNIDLGSELSDIDIYLYDANGKLLFKNEINNTETTKIDLSKFAKGIYTIQIQSSNGLKTQKVSKM
ncbi:MAG: choice-of-anchor J domain-containing protein [Brumimicrobium sp.]